MLLFFLPLSLFGMQMSCDEAFLSHMAAHSTPKKIELSDAIYLLPKQSHITLANNRIALHEQATFKIITPTQQQALTVTFTYSALPVVKNGALYAHNGAVESFKILHIDALAQQLLALTLSAALQNYFNTHPIYTFSKELTTTLHATITQIKVANKELTLTLQPTN